MNYTMSKQAAEEN